MSFEREINWYIPEWIWIGKNRCRGFWLPTQADLGSKLSWLIDKPPLLVWYLVQLPFEFSAWVAILNSLVLAVANIAGSEAHFDWKKGKILTNLNMQYLRQIKPILFRYSLNISTERCERSSSFYSGWIAMRICKLVVLYFIVIFALCLLHLNIEPTLFLLLLIFSFWGLWWSIQQGKEVDTFCNENDTHEIPSMLCTFLFHILRSVLLKLSF